MAINRNFIVKQGVQVGGNATSNSTWSSNGYTSNKSDVLSTPSLKLDFSNGFIDPRVKSLRASGASYLAANGKVVAIGANTPRIEYTTQSRYCLGLVAEEQRTNTAWYSDIEGAVGTQPRVFFSAGIWPEQGPTVSTDFWIGPNKQSAKHVRGYTGGGDNNVGYLGQFIPTVNNTTYTFSVYVYIPASALVQLCNISFETGMLALNPNPTASANLQIRDQWQRLTGTALVTSGANGSNFAVPVLRIDPVGAVVYTDCWQIEQGEYASTWIPTPNVISATRASDINYVYPIRDSVFNPYQFSVLSEAIPKWSGNTLTASALNSTNFTGSGNRHIWGIDWATGPVTQYGSTPYNGYGAQTITNLSGAFYVNSREYANTTPGSAGSGAARFLYTGSSTYTNIVANTLIRGAYAIGPATTTFVINGNTANLTDYGGTGATVYSNTIYVDRLLIGSGVTGGVPNLEFGGNIRKLSLFPKMLSNNEITALSET